MKTWTKRTTAVCLLLALFLTAIPCASAKQYTDVTRSALPDYFDASEERKVLSTCTSR